MSHVCMNTVPTLIPNLQLKTQLTKQNANKSTNKLIHRQSWQPEHQIKEKLKHTWDHIELPVGLTWQFLRTPLLERIVLYKTDHRLQCPRNIQPQHPAWCTPGERMTSTLTYTGTAFNKTDSCTLSSQSPHNHLTTTNKTKDIKTTDNRQTGYPMVNVTWVLGEDNRHHHTQKFHNEIMPYTS